MTLAINNLNEAPVITAPNGGNSASLNVAEKIHGGGGRGRHRSGFRPAPDNSLSGDDADLFTINSLTGVVTFTNAPDFEDPQDAGSDNVYKFTVTATDNGTGSLGDSQDFAITVTDVGEGNPPATLATLPPKLYRGR